MVKRIVKVVLLTVALSMIHPVVNAEWTRQKHIDRCRSSGWTSCSAYAIYDRNGTRVIFNRGEGSNETADFTERNITLEEVASNAGGLGSPNTALCLYNLYTDPGTPNPITTPTPESVNDPFL